jgi:Fur family peroxide stress response transcriptional regulator
MSASTNAIVQTMKERGLRVTSQRFAVYANLLQRHDHPTVDQILTALNIDGPVSSLATVYTSLQALRAVGLVREVLLEAGVARYDAKVEPHHHFCCQSCGAIEDIDWQTFDGLNTEKIQPSLHVQTYEVVVRGLCAECQAATDSV